MVSVETTRDRHDAADNSAPQRRLAPLPLRSERRSDSPDLNRGRDEILTVIAVVWVFLSTASVIGYIAWLLIKAW